MSYSETNHCMAMADFFHFPQVVLPGLLFLSLILLFLWNDRQNRNRKP
jgi:hypothetical protein